jgi:hypothetical protein
MGTGGSDNNSDSSLTSEHSRGLEIGANGSGGNGGTANDVISSASGAISLTGVGGSSPGGVDGIQIDSQNGGSSSITSSAGSITLNGSLPNQTATQALGSDGDAGVTMSGDPSSNALSSITAEAGSIDILGTISSGTSNSKQAGVVLSSGTAIQAEGTGGSGFDAQGDVSIVGNTTGSTALSLDVGVLIEETKIAASGVTSDILGNSGLTIQGTASEIDGASGTTLGSNAGFSLAPLTAGVGIVSGATLEATGAATMTITGTGGENSSINPESSSFGIVMFSTAAKAPVSLTTGSGVLALTGTAGTSPFTQDGILIGGPLNVGSVTINAGGDFSAIATSNADIFIAADISAATTTLSDPGQEVDFFNMGPSSFGPLNLSAATAVVYQQPSIDLNFAFVSGDLTLLTAGNIEQSGPLVSYVDPALLSAAAGGSITLNGFGNFFASLGQINASGSVSISSQGAPLTPGSLNSSTIFPLEIQGLPYVIDLNLVNLLPTLGLTIQPIIGTSASAPTSLGGGSILGQELAIVLPVENQVAPGDVDIVPVIVVVDSSDLGGDISYNRHGGTSRIYQAVSTLGGASSGDAEVGPNDVVQLHGGTVNTSHLPPGLAHALQNALNTQVRQDLSTALGGP